MKSDPFKQFDLMDPRVQTRRQEVTEERLYVEKREGTPSVVTFFYRDVDTFEARVWSHADQVTHLKGRAELYPDEQFIQILIAAIEASPDLHHVIATNGYQTVHESTRVFARINAKSLGAG